MGVGEQGQTQTYASGEVTPTKGGLWVLCSSVPGSGNEGRKVVR